MGLAAISAQEKSLPSFYFDFGTGKTAPGFVQVTPSLLYTDEKGFGFEETTGLIAVNRKGTNALTDDFISSSKPFFFSVRLPQGNYNISLVLGDRAGESATTVRVECRRMMLEQVKTKKGEKITATFTVNVRDSLIGDNSRKVKLKTREHSYYHWDNKLSFEFNGEDPKLAAMEITPAYSALTIFLAGNSTVVDQADEPYAAWGQMIPAFFQPGAVAVCNLAESGESLSSFIAALRLEKALSMMKKGDYFFIEFGHNDQKQTGPGIGAFTSYKKDLKKVISETKNKGGIPVLVTSMHRRSFDSSGKILNTLGDYPEAMRQVAREDNVALIDLNHMSKQLYESWGIANSVKAFVHYPENSFPGQDKALSDNTHFNPYGAYEIARCIAKGIKEKIPALAVYLQKNIKPFDPSSPDPIETFHWPLSRKVAVAKPDGN